jgi:hypothetical protein
MGRLLAHVLRHSGTGVEQMQACDAFLAALDAQAAASDKVLQHGLREGVRTRVGEEEDGLAALAAAAAGEDDFDHDEDQEEQEAAAAAGSDRRWPDDAAKDARRYVRLVQLLL